MTRHLVLAASCAVLLAAPAHGQAPATPAPQTFEQKMAWILRLEDQRILRDANPPLPPPAPAPAKGGKKHAAPVVPPVTPDLVRLLSDPEGRVRRRAALAVGRVGLAEGVAPLARVLAGDVDAEVRQMAAFALGLVGQASGIDPLRAALNDASPLVQGRAAEALGLLGDAASAKAIAAMATARLTESRAVGLDPDDLTDPQPPATEAFRLGIYALTRLKAFDALAAVVIDAAGEPRLRWWPVAYALARVDDARAAPALLTLARAGGSLTKALAAKGLGSLKDTVSVGTLVLLAQNWQEDQRSAISAIRALAQIGSLDAAPALRRLLQSRTTAPNVRLEAVAALGALHDREVIDTLLDLLGDPWPSMRAAALRAVRDIDGETFVTVLSGLDPDPHPSVRAALASMLSTFTPEIGGPRLTAMLADKDPRVLPAVIEAMVAAPARPADLGATLIGLLNAGDVMVRAAAATGLGTLKPAGADRALAESYRAWQTDGLYQARAAALASLAKYGAEVATPVLREALADRDWAVRLRAAALLRGLTPAIDVASRIRPAPGRADDAYAAPGLVSPPVSPHVYLDTDKGTIEIELAVLDAPLTCENFVKLAQRGFFTGQAIHRVVPNFVVQAGDDRGDGEGSPGYTIRDEINMRPYLRGTVGMALDGADTGGSQWFVTHAPQPHLDAKYTVFGRVVAGMDVVDRLQQWDVIRRVRTWDGTSVVSR
ncbi:MAG: HEAT repeat domain-containing protein [Acidobacteria bacterium]|nr:HEAT repeat domain-containing protein [Acidobacteriota bacterium]